MAEASNRSCDSVSEQTKARMVTTWTFDEQDCPTFWWVAQQIALPIDGLFTRQHHLLLGGLHTRQAHLLPRELHTRQPHLLRWVAQSIVQPTGGLHNRLPNQLVGCSQGSPTYCHAGELHPRLQYLLLDCSRDSPTDSDRVSHLIAPPNGGLFTGLSHIYWSIAIWVVGSYSWVAQWVTPPLYIGVFLCGLLHLCILVSSRVGYSTYIYWLVLL